jgi:hypothetical protein
MGSMVLYVKIWLWFQSTQTLAQYAKNPKTLLFISNKFSLNANLQEEYYIKSNHNKKMCTLKKMGIHYHFVPLSKTTSY